MPRRILWFAQTMILASLVPLYAADPSPLPGTIPLTLEGDIASHLVDGVDRFLLRKIEEAAANREKHWKRDTSSAEAYNKSIEPNRQRLAHVLGLRDPRPPFDGPEYIATTDQAALVGKGEGFEVYAVRWPAVGFQRGEVEHHKVKWPLVTTIYGEGLLLVPTGREPIADVVAIPHCDQMPEQIVGLIEGVPAESQYARRLAESGCRVIVPMLINRQEFHAGITNREFLYRSSFILGRHLIGYELQKVFAAVDWFEKDSSGVPRVGSSGPTRATSGDQARVEKDAQPVAPRNRRKIGVIGYGDGGMLALYAAALDPRIDAAVVSGYFGDRNDIGQQPIDRNVFGLLERFGDAELALMTSDLALTIDGSKVPKVSISGGRGAPSIITPPSAEEPRQFINRTEELGTESLFKFVMYIGDRGFGANVSVDAQARFFEDIAVGPGMRFKEGERPGLADVAKTPRYVGESFSPTPRRTRQFTEIDNHNQLLLHESQYVRDEFIWKKLDYSSIETYEKSVEPFREHFATQVIGRFDEPLLPANPRTRKVEENEKWTRYEVVLDVFPDVIAYGLLTLPKDIREGEKRPVVVCQHGLSGRPQDVIGEKNKEYYKAFATELAERGFITFAPQNLYIFDDRFRTLQRKANPLGKTLFSIIVPQHQQIVDWLQALPQVDPERIAFYGLSYGGKSAMRIPPLVTDYALSICSADFNEWVDKNASTRGPYSYVWTGEYEIYEWDLGSTFNYAEMAALIAPRPFMVERGHFDGVGMDQNVAWEYAKVRHLYAARLGIPDKTEIEWFVGPHSIHGVGTYKFLHKHLSWPEPGTAK